jgi:hypothetical protein
MRVGEQSRRSICVSDWRSFVRFVHKSRCVTGGAKVFWYPISRFSCVFETSYG